jgi:hypothetical protein
MFVFSCVSKLDIVTGRTEKVCALLEYVRDKFDLDFLFIKAVNEQELDQGK